MKTVIVLPTYNEKDNISIIIGRLLEVFRKIKHDMHILVVDDRSPDGTADIVRKLQKKSKNIHLLLGDKRGLGIAYQRGFKHAMEKLDAEVVFEMDADLSHPPKLVPKFMKHIEKGYDFVIGSRYIPGGATPDWKLHRKLISWGGNFFARIIAGLFIVHDCTSGFRAIRTELLKKIDFRELRSAGYSFQMSLLYEAIIHNAKFKEVPLVFYDRKYGETKISGTDIIEFFINSFRLRLKSMKKMIKFLIVGASGVFVNLGIFTAAKYLLYGVFGQSSPALLAASVTGDEISILTNFYLNNVWTFKKAKNNDSIKKKLLKFHIVSISSIVINNIVLFTLHLGFGVYDVLAKFIGILVAFMWNYFFSVRWTWKEK